MAKKVENLNSKSVFEYRLFCWNWKIIAKSIVNKDKS